MESRRQADEASAEPAATNISQQRRSPRVELSVEIGIDDHTNFYVGF
jgi:hypothetical protein